MKNKEQDYAKSRNVLGVILPAASRLLPPFVL